ncbi:unnamed protein product, partial [Vitrella brassicaformis CCMP3155]
DIVGIELPAGRDTKFALIVEKETIFSKLILSDFVQTHGPLILVTAHGYPDLPTRHFLRLLRDTHPWLPFGCLVDHDVHGFSIAATYVIGPEKTQDGWFMQPGDMASFRSEGERKRPEKLLGRLREARDAGKIDNHWCVSLDEMIRRNKQFELEAIESLDAFVVDRMTAA